MKKLNLFLSLILIMMLGSVANAQTIDDVIAKANVAMGGQAAIDGVKSLRMTLKGVTMGKETVMEILIVKPHCKLIKMKLEGMDNTSATNGKDWWMKQNGKVMDMPASSKEQFPASFNQYCGVGIGPLIDNGTFSYSGKEVVDGTSFDIVKGTITGSGDVTIYFDEAGLPFRILMPTESEGDLNMYMKDYRDVGGMKMAYKFESNVKGAPFISLEVTKVEVNVDIDPSVFAKPAE